jgi:hypothetical protein
MENEPPPPLTVAEVLDRHFRQADEQTPLAGYLRDATTPGEVVSVPLSVSFDAQNFAALVHYSLSQITTLRQVCYELATVVDALVLNEIDPNSGDLGID